MQQFFDRLRSPRARAGRTHGGFGFAPPPRVSRAQANYAALATGVLILIIAGTASLGSPEGDAGPTHLAAAVLAPSAPIVAAAAETEPGAIPTAAVATPAAQQADVRVEPAQPSAATTVLSPRPTLADAQAMQRQPQPAPPVLSFQSPYEGMARAAADTEATAAIADGPASGEPVAVAESDAEVAQLEAEQPERSQPVIQEENGNAFNSPIMGDARANQHVNLRAGPSDNARVVMVVPANARIQAAKDCAYWCEVVYEGKRGFIYKSFIARSD